MSSRAIRKAMVVNGGTGSKKRRREAGSTASSSSSSTSSGKKTKGKPQQRAFPNPYHEAFEALKASWPKQLREGRMLDPTLDDDERT